MAAEGAIDEITGLIGREVYSTSGTFVGDVEDIKLNLDEEVVKALAIANVNREIFGGLSSERGVYIPYRWVRSVGDIVLISDNIERLSTTPVD